MRVRMASTTDSGSGPNRIWNSSPTVRVTGMPGKRAARAAMVAVTWSRRWREEIWSTVSTYAICQV